LAAFSAPGGSPIKSVARRGGEEYSHLGFSFFGSRSLIKERFSMKRTALSALSLALLLVSPALVFAETPGKKETPKEVAGPGAAPAAASVTTYEELLTAVRDARAQSVARVEKAVDQEKVREAWEIGKLIDTHVLQHKERADYGQQVMKRLAADLGQSETELRYMLQFARTYPIHRPADELSWSQYQALLAVNDPKERETLAAKAVKEKWNRDQTREEVKKVKVGKAKAEARAAAEPVESSPSLKAEPGKPGTYRVVKALSGPETGKVVIDLGFSNYYKTSKDLRFKEGALIESTPPFAGGGSAPADLIRLSKRTEGDLYTYRAWVKRVLDGDTLEAVVDLGFGVRSVQTLRLRAIDCPELISKEGKEAKAFVEQVLACSVDRGPCPAILIKTTKSDKYDRYLADVWVTSKDGKQLYLNNELLQKGLAVKVQS